MNEIYRRENNNTKNEPTLQLFRMFAKYFFEIQNSSAHQPIVLYTFNDIQWENFLVLKNIKKVLSNTAKLFSFNQRNGTDLEFARKSVKIFSKY